MPVSKQCDEILKEPCPYKFNPLQFINGHSFCPCILKAIRTAYIGGYLDAKEGKEPEVGINTVNPTPVGPDEQILGDLG